MKPFLTGIVAAALAVGTVSAGTLDIYENFGLITSGTNVPPQIDAFAFANYGTFQVATTLPYDFQNVRHFTNRGAMLSTPGFFFDTAFSAGKRVPAIDFYNASGATITSVDGPPLALGLNQIISPSYLNISATNVTVQGILSAGAGGLLRIDGNNVNLNRGGLEIRRIAASPITPYVTLTNFWPDIGITDDYWALTNALMNPATILDVSVAGTNVTVPQHVVTNANGNISRVSFQLNNPLSFVQTNKVTDTNWAVQAAFVGGNPALDMQVRFAPVFGGNAPFQTIVVGMSMPESNVVTGDIAFNTLYLKDELASLTNYTVLSNILSAPVGTYRPANFDLTRDPPQEFFTGTTPSGLLPPDLFYSQSLSNSTVTNIYASYAANISSLPIQPPQVPGFDFTNLPGRVEIKAQDLNLDRTRIRGNAFVNIDTPNLLGSSNAVVDSPNLNFNLGAIQHLLSVTNLAQQTVPRLFGDLRAWSALWTNYSGFLTTNIDVDMTDPANVITNTTVITNVVEIAYHALVVDTSFVQTEAPVVTHDLRLHAKDVNIGDVLNVQRSFFVDANSLTISGSLSLGERAEYWRGSNAPTVQFFTNKGALFVNNGAYFVEGRGHYSAFVNAGSIQASGVTLQTDYFEHSGDITVSVDGVRIDAVSGFIQRGSINAARDVVLSGGDLKFFRNTNNVLGALTLNATGGLSDSGAGSENFWSVRNGFFLPTKPQTGDLLGTTIRTFAPKFSTIQHQWAGEDRGTNASGFKGNAALGTLILAGEFDSVVRFSGVTGNNALYVDQLIVTNTALSALVNGDLGAALEIDPDFVIYFASANVPADQLDGQVGGRLIWVPSFIGPNSGVDVLRRDGRTEQMNRAVRDSTLIDSDNDGLPNAADAYPLDPDSPLAVTSVALNAPPGTVAFTWEAKPKTVYRVEYTPQIGSSDWRFLMGYTNAATTLQSAVAHDRLTSGAAQRFYRVQSVEQLK